VVMIFGADVHKFRGRSQRKPHTLKEGL